MASISLETLLSDHQKYMDLARSGAIFVYPTDTIYGIGSTVSPHTIKKIDQIKQRQDGKHYPIIAPSFDRIDAHFFVPENFEHERYERKEKFPGRGLMLLLPIKDKTLSLGGLSTNPYIGVRIIDHPFQQFVTELGQPFITTSCNLSGSAPIKKIDELPSELLNDVDLIVDGGLLDGQPSVIIEYPTKEVIRP